jgi:hypothetical protein
MRPSSENGSSAVIPSGTGNLRRPFSPVNSAFVDLLEAHELACAQGRPLLTEAGVAYVSEGLLPPEVGRPGQEEGPPGGGTPQRDEALPLWDPECRRLWLGRRLLKEFRQPAPNQTRLLDAFQESGWAAQHIDDPLPRADWEGEEDARRRLHETVKNLNRSLPAGTLWFRGDGTGQGVRWEHVRPPARGGRKR